MNWTGAIQRALDYIEEHLTETIDAEAVAKEAFSSPYHFQRVFSALCGFTLGDYIRMRRLAIAAEALQEDGAKVIDVALRFGYDTPESFTRAFTRFHGITPSEAKHGGPVRSFSRLSVKLILTGGTTMEYRIEKPGKLQVLCRRRQITKPASIEAIRDITEFWQTCGTDGSLRQIIGCKSANARLDGLLGISFSAELEAMRFPYAIGVEYDGRAVPDGLEVVEIPAYTYAVFPCKGRMPDAFTETYRKIVAEFFPQSSRYEYAQGVELELYPSEDVENPDYRCEIWIAVNEK